MSLNVHDTPWYNRIRSKRMVQTVRFFVYERTDGMNVEKLRAAFEDLPADNGFYSEIDRWAAVYEGHPAWQTVKKAGLQANKGGTRQDRRVSG
jgi:hypothetical protein